MNISVEEIIEELVRNQRICSLLKVYNLGIFSAQKWLLTHSLLVPDAPATLIYLISHVCILPCSYCFPGGSDGKESACSVGDLGSIPGLGRSRGGRHGDPLQYS